MHIKLTNGQPEIYSIVQLRRDNPQTSFPKNPSEELLATFGVYPYLQEQRPDYDSQTATLILGDFVQNGAGGWVQPYVVEELPLQQTNRNIRNRRDELLSETDWMALSDNTLTPEWATYRQSLRDVTDQTGFPYSVVWPTKPN